MSVQIPALNWTSIAPHMALAAGGIVLLMLAISRRRQDTALAFTFALASVALAFMLALRLWGRQEVGFGGMLALDGFGTSFSLVFLLGAAVAILLSANHLERSYLLYPDYFALILFATLGMMFLASATNLVMMFLGLETLSVSLYVLAGQRRTDPHSLEAALKYFLLGAFATAFFLLGVALLYGACGSLALAQIGQALAQDGSRPNALLAFGFLMLLIGFGFKIALVPFHMWTPDVYHGAPAPISGFMATGSKAAAFAALVRLFLGAAGGSAAQWTDLLWLLAVLTMTAGNVIAVVQDNVKRMLAYSSIAHAGYVLTGVVAANELSVPSVIFYLLAYTLMNLGAFGVVAALSTREGERQEISRYAGLGHTQPALGAAMALFMFSLAGIPPTAGFMAKLYVFNAALKSGYLWLVILGVVNSMVSVYYYLRVVVYLYMRDPEEGVAIAPLPKGLAVGLAICGLGVLWFGVYPASAVDFLRRAVMLLG
jgi:NADH-quinone oxidoreductase subunit N